MDIANNMIMSFYLIVSLNVAYTFVNNKSSNIRIKRSRSHAQFPNSNNQLDRTKDECGKRSVAFSPHRNPKIVGGIVAPYGAFPWQVIKK